MKHVGKTRYPDTRAIDITADAGGSNGHRARLWKAELQRRSDELSTVIRVSHFPPGTSKWNKIEHRLFSFISMSWRGRPLRTYDTVIDLISNTTNRGGLVVRSRLDRRRGPLPCRRLRKRSIRSSSCILRLIAWPMISSFRSRTSWRFKLHCSADIAAETISGETRTRTSPLMFWGCG